MDTSNMICLFDGQVHLPESFKSEKHQHPYEAFRLTKLYTPDITIKFLSDDLIRVILDIFTDKNDIKYSVDNYHDSGHLTVSMECIENVIRPFNMYIFPDHNDNWGNKRCCWILPPSNCSYNYPYTAKDPYGFGNSLRKRDTCGEYTMIFMIYRDIRYHARLCFNIASDITIRYITSENRLLQSQLDVLSSKFNSLQSEMREMRRSMAMPNRPVDCRDNEDDSLMFLDFDNTLKSDKDTQTELTMQQLSKLDTVLDLLK